MRAFAETAQELRRIRDPSRKLDLLTAYFRGLSHTQLSPAVRFLAGTPIKNPSGQTLAVHASVFQKLAMNLFDIPRDLYRQCYRVTTDHGEMLANLQSPSADRTVPIEDVDEFLQELVGLQKNESKLLSLERYLATLDPLIIKSIVRIITRSLKTGLSETDHLRALAVAFNQDVERIEAAYLASNDLGRTARQAATDTLPPMLDLT